MERPIKNACHSLNVIASWAVVSHVFLPVIASIQFSLQVLFVLLFAVTYLSFSFLRCGLWSIIVVLDCVSPRFFPLCPTSSFCSVPSSSLPVLIWKYFGLQWMMVDIEEIKRPCGPINSPFKKTFKQPNNSLVKSTIRALDYYAVTGFTLNDLNYETQLCSNNGVCLLSVSSQQC